MLPSSPRSSRASEGSCHGTVVPRSSCKVAFGVLPLGHVALFCPLLAGLSALISPSASLVLVGRLLLLLVFWPLCLDHGGVVLRVLAWPTCLRVARWLRRGALRHRRLLLSAGLSCYWYKGGSRGPRV